MKYLDVILKSWLPNISSRLIAGLTIVLVGASIRLTEFLQKYDISLSKDKILLIRVSVPLTLLFLGSFFILCIVVKHSKILNVQTKTSPPHQIQKKIKLSKLQKSILLHIHKHIEGLFTFQIAQAFNISNDIAEYHLQELHKIIFIRQGLPDKPGKPWHITDKGKKYLIENKLIS